MGRATEAATRPSDGQRMRDGAVLGAVGEDGGVDVWAVRRPHAVRRRWWRGVVLIVVAVAAENKAW